jgi:hypothetical protein
MEETAPTISIATSVLVVIYLDPVRMEETVPTISIATSVLVVQVLPEKSVKQMLTNVFQTLVGTEEHALMG